MRRPAYRRRERDFGFHAELREPSTVMVRERHKLQKSEADSTDARSRGGAARSSVEAAVMAVERRGRVLQPEVGVN